MSVKSLISKFEPDNELGKLHNETKRLPRKVSMKSLFNPYADLSSSIPKTDPKLLETPCTSTVEILSVNLKDDLSRIESIAKVRYSRREPTPEEERSDVYLSWDEKLDLLSRKLSSLVPTFRGDDVQPKGGREYFVDAPPIDNGEPSEESSVDKVELPHDSQFDGQKEVGVDDGENIHSMEKSPIVEYEAGTGIESSINDTRIRTSKILPQGVVFHKTAPLELIDEEIKTPEVSHAHTFEPPFSPSYYLTPTSCRTIAFNVDRSDPRKSMNDSFRSQLSFPGREISIEENLQQVNSELFDNDVYEQLDTPVTPQTDTFQPKEDKSKVYYFNSSGSSIPPQTGGPTFSSPTHFPFLSHIIDEPDAKKWYQNIFHFRPKRKSSRTIPREEFQPIVVEEDKKSQTQRRYSKQSMVSKASKDRKENASTKSNTGRSNNTGRSKNDRKISVDMIKTPHWVPRPPIIPNVTPSNTSKPRNFTEVRQVSKVNVKNHHIPSLDDKLLSPADLSANPTIDRLDADSRSGSTKNLSNIITSTTLDPPKNRGKSSSSTTPNRISIGTQTDSKSENLNDEDKELKDNFLNLRETIFQVFTPQQKHRFSTILDDIFDM